MEVNKQQIPNGEHCNQTLKKAQLFQENGCLKKDAQLLSVYSRLCTKNEYADMELALIIEQGSSIHISQTTQEKQALLHFSHRTRRALQTRGGYSQKNWVGVCGPLPKTLTPFMTKICDIPYPIYDLTKNSKLNL